MDKSSKEDSNPFSFFKYDKSLDEEDDLDDQSSVVITKLKETVNSVAEKKNEEKSKDNPYSIFAYLENSPAKPKTTPKKSKSINSDDDILNDDFSDEEGDSGNYSNLL